MPSFVVNTNVARADVPAALLSEATNELAKVMEKPAQVARNRPPLVCGIKKMQS